MPAYITGISAFLPNKPVASRNIESVLGQVGGQPSAVKDTVLNRNGIKWRYYAVDPKTGKPTHNNAQLTTEAIKKLTVDDFTLDDIELLVSGTSSPDQMIPNHACMVHGLLGCPPCEVVSTAGVCCSGMTAMKYAYMSVLSGGVRNAIATGSEIASSSFKPKNFKPQQSDSPEQNPYIAFNQEFLRFMLSDGAGAVRISDSPRSSGISLRIDWIDIVSFANQAPPCMYAGTAKQQDGSFQGFREVEDMETAVNEGYFNLTQDVNVLAENIVPLGVQGAFTRIQKKRNLKPEEIDWALPHLSSMFFKDQVQSMMAELGFDLPKERWFTNLAYKGNTGSASIYIMLEELWSAGKLEPGHRILCAVPESARFSYAYMHLTVEE